MISEKKQRIKYILGDFISANIGWLVFNLARYTISYNLMQSQGFYSFYSFMTSSNVLWGQLIIPIFILFIFHLSGYYNIVFRKSRLQELIATILSTLLCTVVIFFAVLINDAIADRITDYEIFLALYAIVFTCVYLVRLKITTNATRKIHGRIWTFKTLIIGNGREARTFADKLNKMSKSLGYEIVGFINIPGANKCSTEKDSYELSDISRLCNENDIKEFLIVSRNNNITTILNVVNQLFTFNLPIKISPNLHHILMANAKLYNITGEPLVNVAGNNMSESATNIKRFFDIVISAIALLFMSPFFLIISILIKYDSKGSIFYSQERIGFRNRPFKIHKFRTMKTDAEIDGIPQLSTVSDDRVTKLGKFMRKYRIDELPQFWNILIGDMSLVGPRPERQYYIDQIMEIAPYYALVHQVRPGLTSMGMVKFGYASSVKEMKDRLRYDLLYLENMSLLNDMKIMVYTIKTVISGKGL